jgi:hypothetical protein
MSTSDFVTLAAIFLALIGVIVVVQEAAAQRRHTAAQTRQQRIESAAQFKRKQLDRLCELRATLQLYGHERGDITIREPAYGGAFSILLTLPDEGIVKRARQIMDNDDYPAKNAMVDEGITVLARTLREMEGSVDEVKPIRVQSPEP